MFSKRTHLRPLTHLAIAFLFGGSMLAAQTVTPAQARPSRIEPHANLTPRTPLSGHRAAWANPSADVGPAGPDTPLRLTLLLARTPALQSSFDRLLADQQNPASPRYHQWLTPAQIGEQFGPTLDEIATVNRWLTTQGLQVAAISPSRTFLDVTATAATAAAAFATTFHLYTIPGDTQPTRLAAAAEPSIPTALAPVLLSIEGLTDIPFRSFHTVRPADSHTAETLTPLATSSSGAHYLFPGDFARIYDIVPTTSAGYDGTGVKVAIAGQSRITTSDVTQFQAMAGLPAKAPNTILLPTSADPGLVKGDEDESTLDVTRALTIAPGIQADLVIAAPVSGGVSAAIQYEINTLLDPILSISYGACETASNASSVQFYNTLFAQAAAQGISTFVSSGDSAAAGCSAAFSAPKGTEALAMGNYLCSSSYVTCVGGTEFADTGLESTYWASANGANYTSALGYIPEGAWNEPALTSATGIVTYQVAGSGSGPSAYIAKPAWQTGTGVPSDGARDIPDIAFTAANHDGYYACLAYIGSGGDCSKGGGVIFSGTSASAPDMAGIAALLNQRLGGSQGNLNPLLYRLAASNPAAFHDATPASSRVTACSTATPSLCNNSTPGKTSLTGGLAGYPLQVGYDLVTGLGSLDVTAFLTAASIPVAASTVTLTAPTTTVPAGQNLALTATVASGSSTSTPTGTIQFTAPGAITATTVPLANGKATATPTFTTPGTFVVTAAYSGDNNFQPATSTPITLTVTAAATTTTVTLSPSFLATGQSGVFTAKVASSAAPAPTGTVQFLSNGTAIGSPVALINATATSPAVPFATAGTYTITAAYSGDANDLPSNSPIATLTVAAPGATLTTVSTTTPSITPSGTALISARVNGNGSQTPTGNIQFYANATAIGPSINLINGFNFLSYSGFTLPGTYTLTAAYTGDTANAPSTSAPTLLTVSKYIPLAAAFTATSTAISTAQTTIVKVSLSTPSTTAPAPTGTIQLYANGAVLGSPIPIAAQTATSAALLFPATGSYAITAAYSGDASYAPANLSGPTIAVTLPTITVSPSPATITLASGAPTGNTSTLTVATPNGYTGSVALACAITATPASPANPPTCSLSSPTGTHAATSTTTTLTLSTTTPHATSSSSALSQINLLPQEQVLSKSVPTKPLVILSEAKNPRIALLPFGNHPQAALSFAGVLLLFLSPRIRLLRSRLTLLLLPVVALTLAGCANNVSGSAATTTPAPTPTLIGTTAGAYTITVTATPSIGAPTTTTLTLNVQ